MEQYAVHNDAIRSMGSVEAALKTIWNPRTHREIRQAIRRYRPDILHAHNTFPIASPALYYAAEAERVPVVQTLHNYRLICPGATLYRKGGVCEACVGKALPWRGAFHGCYRDNRAASTVVASMLATHRMIGTWKSKIRCYIALTEFARRKFIEGGLPPEKITVKPNFLANDPGAGLGGGGYALFVGRLAEVKGVRTLLDAWEQLPAIPLKIAGGGPLAHYAAERAAKLQHVQWMGHCGKAQIIELMKAAHFLVVPSVVYENFPMTVLEAMACGTPVIASDFGSLQEVVIEGINGVRFAPGDAGDLARVVKQLASEPDRLAQLRRNARRHFEDRYTASTNHRMLLEIYRDAAA
ncbi:MAG: glycosyltransferase [Acidobacteriales bacterium]|nr:glycosyltransferase [Terriglobales bacterium]